MRKEEHPPMGFLDDLKDGLGFDSEEEKAKKAAEKAAEEAKERAEDAAKEAKEAAEAKAKADEAQRKADSASGHSTPAPTPVEPKVAPAPDYTRSAQPQEPAAPPAAPEAQAAPAPKADKPAAEKPKAAKKAEDYRTYTVKSGDTLSEIGARFGVSYQKIAKLNNIENPDLIYPGQKFKIPND